MKTLSSKELTYIGFIVKPSGFKGEVIVGLETIDPDEFPDTDFVFLQLEGLPVPYQLEGKHLRSGNLIIKLSDINDEAAAKKIAGVELYLEELFEDPDGTPAYDDLVGFEVTDDTHGTIGTIRSVEELPMQFIATCNYQGKDILFPLNETIVYEIDVATNQLRVRLPEGLLDVYLKSDEEEDESDE